MDRAPGGRRGFGSGQDGGGYLVRSRRTDAWDAIVTLLLALDADEEAGMVVAERLIATPGDLQVADVDTQRGLFVLRRELMRQRDAGAPWRAPTALEVEEVRAFAARLPELLLR
jgi:hypothetical protein